MAQLRIVDLIIDLWVNRIRDRGPVTITGLRPLYLLPRNANRCRLIPKPQS